MSNHLSQERFETCILGEAGPSEREHLNECPECRAEVERFGKGLALFRRAVRDLADDPVILQEDGFTTLATAPTGVPKWRWTLAAAALAAAVVLPFFIATPKPAAKPPSEMSPEAVMERLNRHLAGTVPEPMEPMLSLISDEQPGSERGAVR